MTSAPTTLRWEEQFGGIDRATVDRHLLTTDSIAHDHDFMELVIVLEGEGIHVCSLGEMLLHKGVALLLRPGTWHAYRDCHHLSLVNFCFPIAMARTEWRHLLDGRLRSILRSGQGLQIARLSDSATDSLDQFERVERRSTGAMGIILWALDQLGSVTPQTETLHPAVEKAVCELEERLQQPWTAPMLAQTVGLDKAYLSRLFKAQLGVGPISYLTILRLEQAASLLRNSEMNCGEVGYEVGYSDPNLFSRRFRTHFSLSPSAYRRRASIGNRVE